MSKLDELTDKRDLILLAEIAALLHNIGKLDPNFLQIPKRELAPRHMYIPSYRFKRFAAPDPALIARAHKEIVEHPSDKRSTFEAELRKGDFWEVDTHEAFVHCSIAAAWQFSQFLTTNGSLYRCLVPERTREVGRLKTDLDQIEKQIEQIQQELSTAVPERKKELGIELNQQRDRLREIRARLKEAQEVDTTEILQEEAKRQAETETRFRDLHLTVAGEVWPLADLLTLFWDDFFYKPDPEEDPDADYKRESALKPWLKQDQGMGLPTLLILSHGEMSSAEKWRSPTEKIETKQPHWKYLHIATAFGFDETDLDVLNLQKKRHELIDLALRACSQPAQQRDEFVQQTRLILEMGLGDTQWPINEINLWDYASTIAALFKSGVARAVLEGKIPTVGEMCWRFLSLRFDGLGYLSQIHHVTDLIGRRKIMTGALNAVQELLEVTYPLGNQVYRDENGVVFVVPDLPAQEILDLTEKTGDTLKMLLEHAFAEVEEQNNEGVALAGELAPDVGVGSKVRGKKLRLGEYLRDEPRPLTASVEEMVKWWSGKQAENREICTVCGVRPVGWGVDSLYAGHVKYYRQQARQRKVCGVCLKRRGRRAEEWAKTGLDGTIWTDEVADANGRFALVVGRFGLEGWLDGALIPTMRKPASFARIRRCWETTHDFWRKVGKEVIPRVVTRWQGENGPYQKEWPRLIVKVKDKQALAGRLGAYHTYETVLESRRVSLVWDAQHHDLISAENLRYLGQQLGLKKAVWQGGDDGNLLKELKQRIKKASPLLLYEPSEYGQVAKPLEVEVQVDYVDVDVPPYTPHIPLLTEPALFMALVPADRAMDIVNAMRKKYEREMAKVRDRLPLHLGVVIAPRRTPLRAVLEAGRAMLERGGRDEGPGANGWEKWEVVERPKLKKADDAPEYLTEGNHHFESWWDVPLERNGRQVHLRIGAMMGDGKTCDEWYPYLLRRPLAPGEEPDVTAGLVHVCDLVEGQTVHIAPSTFDFEFLDTTARRFEIAYDGKGRRRGRPTRPYLLEEIETLQQVWHLSSERLTTSQWMALDGLIEQKRRVWDEPRGASEKYSAAFRQFVHDALRNAEWKKGWKMLDQRDQDLLKRAALQGILNDAINLYHEAMKEKGE